MKFQISQFQILTNECEDGKWVAPPRPRFPTVEFSFSILAQFRKCATSLSKTVAEQYLYSAQTCVFVWMGLKQWWRLCACVCLRVWWQQRQQVGDHLDVDACREIMTFSGTDVFDGDTIQSGRIVVRLIHSSPLALGVERRLSPATLNAAVV